VKTKGNVLYGAGLRYSVTVYRIVNAVFLQEDHAEAHFNYLLDSVSDLSRFDIRLWRLSSEDVSELIAFAIKQEDQLGRFRLPTTVAIPQPWPKFANEV
jgi:hypothetical protein